MKKKFLALLIIVVFGSAFRVQASPILNIDQQNLGPVFGQFSNFNIINDGVTQSFTPTLSGIDALEINMGTDGTSTIIRIDLFSGDGDGGPLLGSSGTVNVTNKTFDMVHFDFGSTISLTPLSLYTFRLTHLGGDNRAAMNISLDNYAGGFPRNPDGTPYAAFDLIFTEGLHATPIPEPTTMLLLGTGLVGVAGAARRKKKNQV